MLVISEGYLHVPLVQRVALADEQRAHEARGDVPRGVNCAVVHPGQAARVAGQRLVLLNHIPHVRVRLSRLHRVGLVSCERTDAHYPVCLSAGNTQAYCNVFYRRFSTVTKTREGYAYILTVAVGENGE